MRDISDKNDIVTFVNQFYTNVREDDIIGPIFNDNIGVDKWPEHLDKMYSFWNSILFGQVDYRGNPFSHHISLNIEKKHFDRWISLLKQTIQEGFSGEKADEVIERASKMRVMFELKLDRIRKNPDFHAIV